MKPQLSLALLFSAGLHLGGLFTYLAVPAEPELASQGQLVALSSPVKLKINLSSQPLPDNDSLVTPQTRQAKQIISAKGSEAKTKVRSTPIIEKPAEREPEKPARQVKDKKSQRIAAQAEISEVATAAMKKADNVSIGSTQLEARYIAELRTRLERYKFYPSNARRGNQQGRVVLRFKINQQGNLVSYAVATSAKHRALDKAAIKALRKASPMPPIPEALKVAQLELMVPFDYVIQ